MFRFENQVYAVYVFTGFFFFLSVITFLIGLSTKCHLS